MKMGVHPEYHKVLFIDTSTGDEWTCVLHACRTNEKRKVDVHEEIPVIQTRDLERTATRSGLARRETVDTEGRIDRFKSALRWPWPRPRPKRRRPRPVSVAHVQPKAPARAERAPSMAQSRARRHSSSGPQAIDPELA